MERSCSANSQTLDLSIFQRLSQFARDLAALKQRFVHGAFGCDLKQLCAQIGRNAFAELQFLSDHDSLGTRAGATTSLGSRRESEISTSTPSSEIFLWLA